MTDPTARDVASERANSAAAPSIQNEKDIQAAAREIVNSLEKSISRSVVGAAILFPIALFIPIAILWAFEAPFWVGMLCFVIPFIIWAGIANALGEITLPGRAARRFAGQFPAGSPERVIAIGMVTEIKTPNKAGQKLLKAISTFEQPTQAPSGKERPTQVPSERPTPDASTRQLLGCFAGIILSFAVLTIGIFYWGKAAEKVDIDENFKYLVSGIIIGVGCGVISVCMKWPGLNAALIRILWYAFMMGLVWMIQQWITRKYGPGPAMASVVALGLILYLLVRTVSNYRRRNNSAD
jgi:hypothetical protein